jgi:hypothetical protein
MAQHRGKGGEWPLVRRNPEACYLVPDGLLRSDRSLAGPLRTGTASDRVGPRGVGGDVAERASDFGMDRVTPRGFDPMGTSDTREPRQEGSELISNEVRGRPRRRR